MWDLSPISIVFIVVSTFFGILFLYASNPLPPSMLVPALSFSKYDELRKQRKARCIRKAVDEILEIAGSDKHASEIERLLTAFGDWFPTRELQYRLATASRDSGYNLTIEQKDKVVSDYLKELSDSLEAYRQFVSLIQHSTYYGDGNQPSTTIVA